MDQIDYARLAPQLVDTMVFTFRVWSGALAIILAMIWWRLRYTAESPPYSRRLNDLAWGWAQTGCFIGAVSFIALDFEYRNITGEGFADIMVMLVWWCWSNAMTVRLAARADKPRFAYLAAAIFMIGMPLYTLVTGG